MRTITSCVLLLLAAVACQAGNGTDVWENRFVPGFMTLAGLSVAGLWTTDLLKRDKVDVSDGFFLVKDRETGQRIFPHILAEYATAGCLIAGAVGQYQGRSWGQPVAMLALGALTYTSVNSLSWVVTKKERLSYGIPMVVTLIGSGISLAILF